MCGAVLRRAVSFEVFLLLCCVVLTFFAKAFEFAYYYSSPQALLMFDRSTGLLHSRRADVDRRCIQFNVDTSMSSVRRTDSTVISVVARVPYGGIMFRIPRSSRVRTTLVSRHRSCSIALLEIQLAAPKTLSYTAHKTLEETVSALRDDTLDRESKLRAPHDDMT